MWNRIIRLEKEIKKLKCEWDKSTCEDRFTNTTDITDVPNGMYYQTVDIIGTGTAENPQYPIGRYSVIDGVISYLDVKSDMAETDTNNSAYVKNKNRVIEVLASRELQPSDDDAILIVKADVTLTLTSNLQNNFSCNIYVRGPYTATIAQGTESLYSSNGQDITEDQMALIFRNGVEFILKV